MQDTVTLQLPIAPLIVLLRDTLGEAAPLTSPDADGTQPAPSGEFVHEEEAQAYLGNVSKSTMRRARKAGLPFVRVGKRCYYRVVDLDRFIASHARKA